MVARHSKQIPIPHKGPRGSPVTDILQACPAIMIATATVAPAGTSTGTPFTTTVIWSDVRMFLGRSTRQVRFDGDLGSRAGNVIHQNARGRERGRDSQALVAGREKY
jgi:hypothetical protein